MFCTKCGKRRELGANFCPYCGSRFSASADRAAAPSVQEQSTQGSTSREWPQGYRCSKLENEELYDEFRQVEVIREFAVDLSRYHSHPGMRYTVPKMVVTNKRIVFLDGDGAQFFSQKVVFKRLPAGTETIYDKKGRKVGEREIPPHYGIGLARFFDPRNLSPFWTLKPSVNEEFDQEFKRNPKAYSKIPMVWWSQGYRDWNWIGTPVEAYEDPPHSNLWVVEVKLVLVRAIAVWGPGQRIPTNYMEGRAQLKLESREKAEALKQHINDVVKGGSPSPFTQAYIANQPVKPMTAGYRAYLHAFWMFFGAVIMAGVLSGMGIPSWIIVPVVLGVCLAIFCFLRQREKSARDREVQ